jgi:DNA-binding response OmpR family regulator
MESMAQTFPRIRLYDGRRCRGRVVLAEDDDGMRDLLASRLRKDGFEVLEARDGGELSALIDAANEARLMALGPIVDLVVSDARMPFRSGLDALEFLRKKDAETPFILITAFGDTHTHSEAYRLGATAVFDKPFDVDDFCTAVVNLVPN